MATTLTSLIVPMINIPSTSIRRLTNLLVVYMLIVLTNLSHYGVMPNFGVVKQSSSFLCGENFPTLGSQSIATLDPWIYTRSFHFYYAINVASK